MDDQSLQDRLSGAEALLSGVEALLFGAEGLSEDLDDQSLQDLLSGAKALYEDLDDQSLQDLLSGAEALYEDLRYRPRTQATRAAFDLILTIVAKNLGDVPHEVVRCVADAMLADLKDEDLKDDDKKKEIDDLLGVSLSPEEFNELVNLGKKLTDYDAEDEATIP